MIKTTKPVLIVLVGLPGTGKSTFREYLKNELEYITISSDDYIDSYAKAAGKTYTQGFEEFVGLANTRIEEDARMAKIKEFNVIWDQTNLSAKKRKKILDKFQNYVKICITFDIPSDWLIRLYERAGKEGKYIPYGILMNMYKTYEEPRYEEGFDTIFLSSDKWDITDYIKRLEQ